MTKKTRKPSSTARRAKEALLAGQARNKAVLAAMPDLMFGLSREGEILYYNAPDASDLYRKPEAFLGKRIDEILPSHVRPTA